MSAARERILKAIRSGLGRGPLDGEKAEELGRNLKEPKPNLVPERANLPHPRQVDLFVSEAERSDASVRRVAGLGDVPGVVASYLSDNGLPGVLKVAPNRLLRSVPWADEKTITANHGPGEDSDQVGVSMAFAGVAETGTLVVVCGPENPATINFLPDTHIVVVAETAIVGTYEEAWRRLREARKGGSFMPRAVTWITGPSRTADIEQTILLGAHGPRRLLIVIAADA